MVRNRVVRHKVIGIKDSSKDGGKKIRFRSTLFCWPLTQNFDHPWEWGILFSSVQRYIRRPTRVTDFCSETVDPLSFESIFYSYTSGFEKYARPSNI